MFNNFLKMNKRSCSEIFIYLIIYSPPFSMIICSLRIHILRTPLEFNFFKLNSKIIAFHQKVLFRLKNIFFSNDLSFYQIAKNHT